MFRLTLPAMSRCTFLALWLAATLSLGAATGGDVSRETARFFEDLHAFADLHQQGRPAEAAERLRPWLQRPDTAHRAAVCLLDSFPPEAIAQWETGSPRAGAVFSFQSAHAHADPGAPGKLLRLLASDPEVFTWSYAISQAIRPAEFPYMPELLRGAESRAPGNPFIPLALAQTEGRLQRFRLSVPASESVRGRDANFALVELLYRANRLAAAARLCDENLRQALRDGDHWRVIECILQTTTQRLAAGDLAGAERAFSEAETECQRLPLAYLRRKVAFMHGYLCIHQGDLPAAADAFRSILPAGASKASDRLQALTLINLGYVLDELGRYEESLDCYRRVIPFYQSSRDWFSLAMARLDRGALRERLNLLEAARQDYQAVLDLPGLPSDSEPRLMASVNLGSIYAMKRQWERAIPLLEQSAALARAAERWDEAAMAGTNLALCHLKRGDLPSARIASAFASIAARRLASPIVQLIVEGVEARLLTASGNPTEALRRLETMVPRADAMDDRTLAWELLYLKGLALAALDRHQEALVSFGRALDGLADLERECHDLYVKLHFLESAGDVVEGTLASLYARQENGEEAEPLIRQAFRLMESRRARVLHRRIETLAPAVQPSDRLTLAEAQQWIGARGGCALMVFEGENHFYQLSFDGNNATFARDSAPRLRQLVDRLENSIRTGAAPDEAIAGELATRLRLSSGQGAGELFVLPSGCLCRIPLEVLPVGGGPSAEPLGVQRPVIYLPSWQFLQQTGASRPRRESGASYLGIHGFTDGSTGRPLPWAEREVACGAQAFGWDRVLLWPAARLVDGRTRAGLSGPEWTIVHVATHVEVNEEDPWRSQILLAGDGPSDTALSMQDLADGIWRSNLVILSGCATGQGRVFRGEGSISLARSCLASGSRAVLTTLWPVADRAAGEFMRHFYDALPRCGGQAAQALREARRQMRQDPAFRDATHWAGYVLYGLPTPILAPDPPFLADSSFVPAWAAVLLLWLIGAGRAVRGPTRP